ncbi:MAG: hypothetical protein QM534_06005 [Sediminibacterium sp.]|nr:hypothetical protein [Sediminibacterium sp.]
MSKEHNNIKNIDELLALLHDEKNQEVLDPFEQEALEGFASMGNEDSARALVSRAQTRMFRRLERKSPSERKKPQTYWLAAAGVILIAALSVVFYSLLQESTQTKQVAVIPSVNPISSTLPETGAQPSVPEMTISERKERMPSESSIKPEIPKKPELQSDRKSLAAPTKTSLHTADEAVTRAEVLPEEQAETSTLADIAKPVSIDGEKTASKGGAAAYKEKITEAPGATLSKNDSEKKRERTHTTTVSQAITETGAASFSAAYYLNGQQALAEDLRRLFKNDKSLEPLTTKELKVLVALNENNTVQSVTILSPVITDKDLTESLKKTISALGGFRTAIQNGKSVKSAFEFVFTP